MVMNGAIGRIVLRYGAGAILGGAVGLQLSADPDLVMIVGLGVSSVMAAGVEAFYVYAKRKGWAV
jgi:hypothetical protein